LQKSPVLCGAPKKGEKMSLKDLSPAELNIMTLNDLLFLSEKGFTFIIENGKITGKDFEAEA